MTSSVFTTVDVYKLFHLRGYPENTTKIYSYLCARSVKKSENALFFGLQYYLKEYLSKPITQKDIDELYNLYNDILGMPPTLDVISKFQSLVTLGYFPIEIKAVPEGTIVDNKNVLMTMTNTHPDFYWVVGFLETHLLKVWAPISVATLSNKYKQIIDKLTFETSDSDFLKPFLVHDFSARGVSSEETAAICGAGHLVNFAGTDTVQAVKLMKEYYNATGLVGASVPASEHSIHQAFGPTEEDELNYVNRMLELNPTGIVSVVSDAYNYWRMLTVTLPKVKDKIILREGKYVVRPDSGVPIKILCGDENAPIGTPEYKGTFRLLEELFGATINSKGYKELNPKIGVIYGDGMQFDKYKEILEKMKEMGYANTNLVVGVGGLLVQQHNRDDLGFAFKATYAEINNKEIELFKDPITDPGKKSHKGLLRLEKVDGKYITFDQQTKEQEKEGLLQTVFLNGKIVKEYSLEEIRNNSNLKG